MFRILLIFLAGGAGSLLRYALAGWLQTLGNGTFPVGTLGVNVTGCLVIGFLAAALTSGPFVVDDDYRFALLIGLLGGFTTFSTFAYETVNLASAGQVGLALLNIVLCNGLGLLAAWGGARAALAAYGV